MKYTRLLSFGLLALLASARSVFACEVWLWNGETIQVCRSPGEFRAAAAAAGVADLGIETFESDHFPIGEYPLGVFDVLYTDPFGASFVTNGVGSTSVAIQRLAKGGKVLRSKTFVQEVTLTLGPVPSLFGGRPFVRAVAFTVGLEQVVSYTNPTQFNVVIPGFFSTGMQAPGFVGLVSTRPFYVVNIDSNAQGVILVDDIQYPGGPDSSQSNPYPPELCPPWVRVGWCFSAGLGPQWYDPMTTNGYEFTALEGAFTSIDDFPTGFSDSFTVSVGGISLGQFSPGQRVDFPPGVLQFRITSITPAVDGDSPTAFPIKLSLDTVGATFVMRPLTDDGEDRTPPTVVCQESDRLWHASDVSAACTASDEGSGLANSADASFTLSTGISAGTETENAYTNQREVCDAAGNCAVAGPVGGHHVDKKPPVVTISTPTAGPYTLGQSIIANYQCADSGSGVASCIGPVLNGTALQTDAVGTRTFEVNASDALGNRSHRLTSFTVTYNVCPLFDQATAKRAGSTIPVRLALCNANGTNVSSLGVQLVATGLRMISGQTATQVEDPGDSNPDDNFRFTDGSYRFNLKTVGLASGTWELTFNASGDPEPHAIRFQIR